MIPSYEGYKVLVTGGAGFIGSHITEKLVAAGASVTVLDNFSTGSINNIRSVLDDITLIGGSITDYSVCLKATADQHIIIHCAAQTSVPESMENPAHCYETNVRGTFNILEAARSHNVKRVVFSSSSAVYGQQEGLCAEDSLCSPSSVYGFSKLYGEMLCKNYFQLFNLETVCFRYFNVYGSRQSSQGPYASAMAKFRYYMQQNQPLVIFGDGQQTRDFISVDIVAQANIKAGLLSAGQVAGQVFNIASGTSVTLLQLVNDLKKSEFPHFSQPLLFEPARAGDIRHIKADCSKFHTIFQADLYC